MTCRDTASQNVAAEAPLADPETLRHLQKLAAMEQVAGGIAHDVNNSFQRIMAALELVRSLNAAGRSGETERFIKSAVGAARDAAAVNQRVYEFLRRQPLDPKPLVINEMIQGMEDMLRRALSRSINLEVKLSADAWQAHCDKNHAETALLNLALNARDAMPEGGTMTIQSSNLDVTSFDATHPTDLSPGQYVCVTVSDSGIGMTYEVREHAVDAFFTTKASQPGLGLGLTMVDAFARQNGGGIKIQSAIGQGSVVALYLPRHQRGAPT